MGLDQYMYLVGAGPKNPQDLVREDGSFDEGKARELGYNWCSCSEPGELEAELADIGGLITAVRATERDVDLDAVRREAGASPVAQVTGQIWSTELKTWSFSDGTRAVYRGGAQPPSRSFERMFLVWKCENLAYWRKDYELDDKLTELYGAEILNCGWHEVSPAMYEAICSSRPGDCRRGWDSLNLGALEKEGQMLAYHIWY